MPAPFGKEKLLAHQHSTAVLCKKQKGRACDGSGGARRRWNERTGPGPEVDFARTTRSAHRRLSGQRPGQWACRWLVGWLAKSGALVWAGAGLFCAGSVPPQSEERIPIYPAGKSCTGTTLLPTVVTTPVAVSLVAPVFSPSPSHSLASSPIPLPGHARHPLALSRSLPQLPRFFASQHSLGFLLHRPPTVSQPGRSPPSAIYDSHPSEISRPPELRRAALKLSAPSLPALGVQPPTLAGPPWISTSSSRRRSTRAPLAASPALPAAGSISPIAGARQS